jgi:hypothetical protein
MRRFLFAIFYICIAALIVAATFTQEQVKPQQTGAAAVVELPRAVPTTTTVPPTTTTTVPPTTTTEPPPTTVAPRPKVAPAVVDTTPAADPYVSMEPCGGDLPPCWVKYRESKGDYTAVNWTGCGGRTCGGAWQFDPRTWNGYGGYTYAQDAPPEVQDEKAREVWAGGAGCSHWAAC